jgi:hypothetical protein
MKLPGRERVGNVGDKYVDMASMLGRRTGVPLVVCGDTKERRGFSRLLGVEIGQSLLEGSGTRVDCD